MTPAVDWTPPVCNTLPFSSGPLKYVLMDLLLVQFNMNKGVEVVLFIFVHVEDELRISQSTAQMMFRVLSAFIYICGLFKH